MATLLETTTTTAEIGLTGVSRTFSLPHNPDQGSAQYFLVGDEDYHQTHFPNFYESADGTGNSYTIFQVYNEVVQDDLITIAPTYFLPHGDTPMEIGMYIKIGNELIQITDIVVHNANYYKVYVERGVEGTVAYGHYANETVEIWHGNPLEDEYNEFGGFLGVTTYVSSLTSADTWASLGLHDTNNFQLMLGGYDNNYVFLHDNGSNANYSSYRQFEDNTFGGLVTKNEFDSPGTTYLENKYLKVGEEIIRVYTHYIHPVFDQSEHPLIYLYMERGVLGTTAVEHTAGEIVELWDGPPVDVSADDLDLDLDFGLDTGDDVTYPYLDSGYVPTLYRTGRYTTSYRRGFIDKPFKDEVGVYSYKNDNDSNNYYDSDSVPKKYDKFVGKDLYTYSVGSDINEAILDSKIISKHNSSIDALQYLGETYLRINSLEIRNRGVNSDINDVYFRIFIFTNEFCNPRDVNGNWLSYSGLYNCLYKSEGGDYHPAWFYSQNGPNYGEGGSPGNLIQNLTLFESFDMLNYGPTSTTYPSGDNSIVSVLDWAGKLSSFDPKTSMPKAGVGATYGNPVYPETDSTTLFQEDGVFNSIFIGIHMDGDLNAFFDRSRDETISLFEVNPAELFDNGVGKHSQLTLSHAVEKYSNNQSYTAAWTAKELILSVNTAGGVILDTGNGDGNYHPPAEYFEFLDEIAPPVSNPLLPYEDLIFQMDPSRQLVSLAPDSSTTQSEDYYTGMFSNFTPISVVRVGNRELQNYYESTLDKIGSSAPNTVELNFSVAVHPRPYPTDNNGYTRFSYENNPDPDNNPVWGYTDKGLQLFDKQDESDIIFFHHNINTNSPFDLLGTTEYIISNNDENYFRYFVINWDDKDNEIETIDDAMIRLPKTLNELTSLQQQGSFLHNNISVSSFHNYLTPGIKNIKSIVYSRSKSTTEPLRWKLVTTRIFLDIPINEFPDFSEVGGADYTTLPWPYTTPIIGGVSQDSKYIKSVNDILGSGKIGDTDIIDETFLVDAKENDELGKNIQTMDLEQVRFFASGSYDMNTLLNIPIETVLVEY